MPQESIDLGDLVESVRAKCANDAYSSFEEVRAWVVGPAQALAVHDVDRELLPRMFALACALMALWAAHRMPLAVPATMRDRGGWYAFFNIGRDVIRCQYGEFDVHRAVYERVGGRGPSLIAPFDRVIGLADGRMTLEVHLRAAWLTAKVVFDEVVAITQKFGAYAPSKRSLLGIVDQIGVHAVTYIENMPAPEGDGEILVIQVDEKGAPMLGAAEHARRRKKHTKRKRGLSQRAARRMNRRSRPRVRRKKGDKSKNARMATAVVMYTLRMTRGGKLEGPLNKRVIATFAGRRHLFTVARREAVRRGLHTKRVYFLADGALDLWSLQREFFPTATPCIDWYHVCEYIWDAGRSVHAEGSKALTAWVDLRKQQLRADDIDGLLAVLTSTLATIPRSGPGTKGRRERVEKAIRYITNHRAQLRYGELLAADLDVATGAVEGALNHVVGRRFDRSMMRWTPLRANRLLALRCIDVNGDWDDFADVVTREHSRRADLRCLPITPRGPQEPYDAVRKAA